MSASYNSRHMVEDYLRYKLLQKGVAWRLPSPRRPAEALSLERTSVLHRGGATATTEEEEGEEERVRRDPHLAPPRLQVVLRCAGDELERCYRDDLSAQVSALMPHDGGSVRRNLAAVREEVFRDGVNWGRIVALMELGGAVSAELARRGGASQVDDVAGWMEESLDSPTLRGWIEDNGGWNAFVDLYGDSRPEAGLWSLRTVCGLVLLGAAGITLGALFTHQ
ncbi:apoptosis regulator Bcl-2-like [Sphaeramia orbicularis]|uniref:Apoptosis regulator Bcl-2-like n=1 Tax=Sphaeramia orbicularis TaxID=375764 RepID=A0A673BH98_9TELE|nr:apoptosis regulator Bcl-2-like [Sphaeramia orbicularis]XP_029979482.1 apoptosis regulator Bcl-2-like [Sphaeramia orbicularis]